MSNTLLTPTAVTREALRILHQKANFIGSINRQYDDSFAKSGAKIGDSLKIRLPNQYSVRTGATLDVQDTTESSTTLQIATQKGVGSELHLGRADAEPRRLLEAHSRSGDFGPGRERRSRRPRDAQGCVPAGQ
jgi:hypothetical protein